MTAGTLKTFPSKCPQRPPSQHIIDDLISVVPYPVVFNTFLCVVDHVLMQPKAFFLPFEKDEIFHNCTRLNYRLGDQSFWNRTVNPHI